jgi:hypothetical protein
MSTPARSLSLVEIFLFLVLFVVWLMLVPTMRVELDG